MPDTTDPIRRTERELHDHPSGLKILRVRRRYEARPEEVWDAIADPDRIVRWFLPLSGDLREGGRYELEGNASGNILRCARPTEIRVTWEYGGGSSEVRVTLTPEQDEHEETVLELEHAPVPVDVIRNVGDMWGVGAGWEIGLVALGDYLAGALSGERAIDRMASASDEELGSLTALAERISGKWRDLLEERKASE